MHVTEQAVVDFLKGYALRAKPDAKFGETVELGTRPLARALVQFFREEEARCIRELAADL